MTKAKSSKSSADAKKNDANQTPEPEATNERRKPATSKSARSSAKPAKAKTPPKSSDTDIIVKEPAKPAPTPGFSNSGLGIKKSTSARRPALSLAPGAMFLGKPAQAKQEKVLRPSERRLSKKEQAEIKNFLVEKRERLLSAMRRELAMQKERAQSKAADEVDKATDAYDEDLSFEIAVANDQELEDIQVALEKIDKGTYGECEICGCGISPSRLKILPSATTCVSCRGQEEMARRRDDGQPLFNMMGEDGEGEGETL